MAGTKEQKRKWIIAKRNAVLALLGGKCNWSGCDWVDPRALQIDHIRGGGSLEKKAIGDWGIYRKILVMPHPEREYQLLCANHNWVKRAINNEASGRGDRKEDK